MDLQFVFGLCMEYRVIQLVHHQPFRSQLAFASIISEMCDDLSAFGGYILYQSFARLICAQDVWHKFYFILHC